MIMGNNKTHKGVHVTRKTEKHGQHWERNQCVRDLVDYYPSAKIAAWKSGLSVCQISKLVCGHAPVRQLHLAALSGGLIREEKPLHH